MWWIAASAWAVCGDGVLDPGEGCDDLDALDGDGCSAVCQVEDGYVCTEGNFRLRDVESWFDPDTGHVPAAWTTSADLLTATETQNSQPTAYVSELGADWVPLAVELEVETAADDDIVGLMLGFDPGESVDPTADWLLVDWKQLTQTETPYGDTTHPAGLALSRVSGVSSAADLWAHAGSVTELARGATLGAVGWADNVPYRFDVVYSRSRVQISVDGVLELDVAGDFPLGPLGAYAFSQEAYRVTLLSPVGISVCGSLDTDDDGLTDAQEDDVGTSPTDPDTDGDGLLDGAETGPDGAYDPGVDTDPRDPDTDDGGLGDGFEVNDGTLDPLDGSDDDVDTDGDGLDDFTEATDTHTDPLDPDTDDDGLGDGVEVLTDPLDADTDDDGLGDGGDAAPTDADADDDGLGDGLESGVTEGVPGGTSDGGVVFGGSDGFVGDADPSSTTDPTNPDTDGDGLLDGAEDADGDGAVGAETDPNDADTDDDGIPDGDEVATSPIDPDSDDDGLLDGVEVGAPGVEDSEGFVPDVDGGATVTDPTNPDTDGDGLLDGEEDVDHDGGFDGDQPDLPADETDPLDPDSDDDGAGDGAEGGPGDHDADGDGTIDALDPDSVPLDSDGDGLLDADEDELGTDPLDPDTDDDGLWDGDELDHETDPLDPDTDDGGVEDGPEVDRGTNPLDGSDDLVDEPGRYLGGACDCDQAGGGAGGVWLAAALGGFLYRRRRQAGRAGR